LKAGHAYGIFTFNQNIQGSLFFQGVVPRRNEWFGVKVKGVLGVKALEEIDGS